MKNNTVKKNIGILIHKNNSNNKLKVLYSTVMLCKLCMSNWTEVLKKKWINKKLIEITDFYNSRFKGKFVILLCVKTAWKHRQKCNKKCVWVSGKKIIL